MIDFIAAKFNYLIVACLMMIGLYGVIAKHNLMKKVIGLSIFQTSVFLFYISMAKVEGGTAPVLWEGAVRYDNPLPHVLILTAIVVSVSTTAVAIALIMRLQKAYGTIEENEIREIESQEPNRDVKE